MQKIQYVLKFSGVVFRNIGRKYWNTLLLILSGVLYNATIIYFIASHNDVDFLYFNSVIIAVISTIYVIENTFQFHFGRILHKLSLNEVENEFSDTPPIAYGTRQVKATITYTYLSLSFVLVLVFVLLFMFYREYRGINLMWFVSTLFYVHSGKYALELVAVDDIKKQHGVIASVRLLFVTVIASLIFCGVELFYSFYSVLITFAIFQYLLMRYFSRLKISGSLRIEKDKITREVVWKICETPIKQALVVICGFIVTKMFVILGSGIVSKDILSSISLFQSLFSLVLMVGGMYTVLNMNKFTTSKVLESLVFYKRGLIFNMIFYAIGSCVLYLFNIYFLRYLSYTSLSNTLFIVMTVMYFFESIYGIALTLFLYLNRIVYLKSYVISASLILIIYLVLNLYQVKMDASSFILIGILIQGSYNYWYYPIELLKFLKVKDG